MKIKLDKETEARLECLCTETGHTKSYYAKKAIRQFLDDRDDYLLGITVLQRHEVTVRLEALKKALNQEK